ncbi:M56 family metallopeptidase [Thiomicrospira sp. R3]|uniref:M56 family metallopeptidase n=1 Tax=Thiomicrospira sp. R3 TaxID=3035472 RepID=UPI00259B1A8E|nr:M56 family metallopeptidase [Thiomicrospira sp. R3]WFE67714.1 M56 family metallopeptidase [Thiomicrospira sp. R3]
MDLAAVLGLVAVLVFLLWLVANGLTSVLSNWLAKSSLSSQRRQLWLLASLPLTLPLSLLVALSLVWLAKHLGWITQHCSQTQPSLFCVNQASIDFASQSLFWLGLGGVLLIALSVIPSWLGLLVEHIRVRSLARLAGSTKCLTKLEHSQPQAFVIGIRHPVIFWSQQLTSLLTKHQQRIVLAHEVAHIRRQDLLKNLVFEILLSFHLAPRALRRYWQFNIEAQVDDRLTARFNRLDIAQVLLTLSRDGAGASPGLAFTGSSSLYRIERLVHPKPVGFGGVLEALLWGIIGFILLFTFIEHHSLEWLIGWLV